MSETKIHLILALKKLYPQVSNSKLKLWIKHGRVKVNDTIINVNNFFISKTDSINVLQKKPLQQKKIGPISVIFEDRNFIIINKPSGLLSVPAKNKPTHAFGLLKNYYQTKEIYPVHRIDRGTSGLLLFAKGKSSKKYFDEIFFNHSINREYVAIIEGHLKEKQGTWDLYLKEKQNLKVEVVSPTYFQAERSITHYEVLKTSTCFSYIKLRLETGKKHQIRVHCSHAGHPILGDKLYGSHINPMQRIALHAYSLEFIHPITKKPIKFIAPLPKQFEALGFFFHN